MGSLGAALRVFAGRIGLALVLCVATVVAGTVAVNRYIDGEVSRIPRVGLATAPVDGRGVNYLVIGSDTRSFVDNSDEQSAFGTVTDSGPPRSDTLMVLHAQGDQSYAVSFPRDLWVDVPGHGKAKINAAFNNGPQAVIDTLKANFNLDINHYLEVNFVAFSKIVDAIGTVGVWFDAPTRDYDTAQQGDTGFYVDTGGCVQLDGFHALQYVRARHMQHVDPATGKWVSIDPIPDIARIQRQQTFVSKLGRTAVERLLADPRLAPDVVDGVIPELTADQGFDRAALNQLLRALLAMQKDPNALHFETIPWTDGGRQGGGQQVLAVKYPEADAVLARLRGEAPIVDTPTSTAAPPTAAPALRPVDVRVKVLNGSGVQGAAANASTDISRLGFVNGGIGNDTRGVVTKSEVRYKPGDDGKAKLVASKLPGIALVADATLPATAVVLVLGKDFKGVGVAVASAAPATAPATTAAPAAGGAAPASPQAACG